jgi:hypothetical protein
MPKHRRNRENNPWWNNGSRFVTGAAIALLALSCATTSLAQPPVRGTRELLKLVPSDAAVVLTVDDLRGQTKELLASRLAAEFEKLPAVRKWFDSEKYEQLENARDQIEAVLQVSLTEVRDQVLGDAVVLAVRLPAEPPFDPSKARGLLVLKAASPALLKRLIDQFNTTQKQNGEIANVVERLTGETHYFVREYHAGSDRMPEAYVLFPDGTFALSNSPDLVTDLIGRKTGKPGGDVSRSFCDLPRFQSVDRQLPESSLARLYVDARLLERQFKNGAQSKTAGEQQGAELIGRYLSAMQSLGAAVTAREGKLKLCTTEVFDPTKFSELFGRYAAAVTAVAPQLDRVPSSALAFGKLDLDLAALYRKLITLVPAADRPRLTNMETAISGILLGQNLQSRILPALGHGFVAFIEPPTDADLSTEPGSPPRKWPFPTVLALGIAPDPSSQPAPSVAADSVRVPVSAAIENALHTFFAVLGLDEKRAQGRSRIVTTRVAGCAVTTLDPPIPLAYAVDHSGHRLVLGTSADVVGRYLQAGSDPNAGNRFRQLRSAAFPDAHSYLCLDIATLGAITEKQREHFTKMIAKKERRSEDEVGRDLDQVIALAHLFDAAFITNRIDASSATIHHSIGLLARQPDKDAPDRPKP